MIAPSSLPLYCKLFNQQHFGSAVMSCFSASCFILKVTSPFLITVLPISAFPPFLLPRYFHLCLVSSAALDCFHLFSLPSCVAVLFLPCVWFFFGWFHCGCFSSSALAFRFWFFQVMKISLSFISNYYSKSPNFV